MINFVIYGLAYCNSFHLTFSVNDHGSTIQVEYLFHIGKNVYGVVIAESQRTAGFFFKW